MDLATLRRISTLLQDGLNLAGIRTVLELEAANRRPSANPPPPKPAASPDPAARAT